MRFRVQYQVMGDHRPLDYSLANDEIHLESAALLPNVGDFVDFQDGTGEEGLFKVKTRLFSYYKAGQEWVCHVNIVMESIDPNEGIYLIKM